ncbi:MAG TPA: class I SAM-dependent methyltransferase [Flavobacteriales bacterium]|nr:methyltransferase domain-containing protein [Flavobacteriales bacterium]HQW86481.1 class I SAM-dependent methyltransferase [Flavobacteriales bacterium]
MPRPGPRPCPVCGATDHRPITARAKDHLVSCGACGMVFTGAEPTPEELAAYYGDYPVHEHLSPVTIRRYDDLVDGFAAYRRTGRMLDVGCGAGIFLERARLKGWEVHGTEFGQRALASCRSRGIAIIEGPLDPANYPAASFDVVCSFEVMEHLTDPGAEMRRMKTLLRPGGALYITTPNYRSMGRLLAGSSWNVVNYPEHLNYFTPGTLTRLAERCGLHLRSVRTTGVSVQRVLTRASLDPARRKSAANVQEDLRERLERNAFNRSVKRLADRTLDLLKVGDTIKAVYERPPQ